MVRCVFGISARIIQDLENAGRDYSETTRYHSSTCVRTIMDGCISNQVASINFVLFFLLHILITKQHKNKNFTIK